MAPTPADNGSPAKKKKRSSIGTTTIQSLEQDTLSFIFSYLGLFDLVRSSAVCKSWNQVIKRSKLVHLLYLRLKQRERDDDIETPILRTTHFSDPDDGSLLVNGYLKQLAMEHHRLSLLQPSVHIHQWKAHSHRVNQCRMKMGLILTGVGDKVMRLWSLEDYKCVAEYSIPIADPILDFDFDESKIVGLIGTRICIWRRNGQRSIFPSQEGTFMKGLCMRYIDPEAVVGCEDGTARVFDMYSRKCSRIIRMHPEPMTCLSLSDDQLIIGGSSLGRITVSGLLSDQRVATLRRTDYAGIKTLCYNPGSHLVFAGTTAGYTSCWDLRTMGQLWETRVSPNVIYSLQHLQNDTSTLIVGGIDGVLRVLDQSSGEVISSYVMDHNTLSCSSSCTHGLIERKIGIRLSNDALIDKIPKSTRPPITCLAVGMKKVVTTHNGKYIRMWKFNS